MTRWTKLRGADPGYDNLKAWITGQQDAVIAAQNAAVACEVLGLGICYMGTTLWAMDKISEDLELPEVMRNALFPFECVNTILL
jgi:FMN reductase (NADPH)